MKQEENRQLKKRFAASLERLNSWNYGELLTSPIEMIQSRERMLATLEREILGSTDIQESVRKDMLEDRTRFSEIVPSGISSREVNVFSN